MKTDALFQTSLGESVDDLRRRNAVLTAQVADLNRALQQVGAVSQITAGIVHDVCNSMQIALGEAEYLASTALNPDQAESAEAIFLATRHAQMILRDLLALSRKVDAKTTLIDSAELLKSSKPLFQRVARPPIKCIFEVDTDAWPVAVERQQLEAAIINLCANARDAMPDGGQLNISVRNLPKGTTLPSNLPPGEYVSFSVTDSGAGMTPEVLARATDAFFTTKAAHGGTGLGLSIVHAFAQRSGGVLQLESERHRGTRAQILLPRAPLSLDHAAHDSAPGTDLVDAIRARIQTEWLREVLDGWHSACPRDGLPRLVDVEATVIRHADSTIVVAVDSKTTPPGLRLLRIGDRLERALHQSGSEGLALNGPPFLGSLAAAYGGVLTSRAPSYEHARYSLGDGQPTEFERLILPAASQGDVVSHLVGIVVLSGVSS